jgi:O-antigen/teichoic acid export membrane protein
MIQWAALGMFFKTLGWSVGFVFLAKGTTKLFFWNELIATGYILSFNLIGYYYWGLTGLGISFTVAYLVYTIQVFFVSRMKFGFSFDRSIITIFTIQFGLAVAGFLTVKLLNQNLTYLAGVILIIISGWFSLSQLNKRLGLLNLLNQYIQKSRTS